ncbi:DUF2946 family protein [Xanthobacter sp. KR7-65]|uniref:DUF2946 family protein n=1 Tax=Xanthobacter sp. KR7-65 TaxID=3156612 RepID=UPI0032B32F29
MATSGGSARALRRRHAAGGGLRLLFAFALSYVVLLQSVAGALAAGAMAGAAASGDAGVFLCLPSTHGTQTDEGTSGPDKAGGVHCILCPIMGGVPVLAAPPALPLPAAYGASAAIAPRAALVAVAPPVREHAQPRAPPAI